MKITRKSTGKKVNLVISIDEKELSPIKTHTLSHFKDSVKIPGFRSGTAPASLLEKHVDQNDLANETVNHAINHFYGQAMKSEKIRPVGQPDVKVKKFVPYSTLEFEVEVDSIGAITLPDYTKIRVPKKPVKITAKDINDIIENLKQRLAERKEVDRASESGDEVQIDFDGYDEEGKAVSGASAKSYPLILGSGSFIPGFEEKLIGVKAGEEKEFKLKFPSDYGVGALADKEVEFKVKVIKVNEVLDPKVDNSFAAKAGPFKTVAELKADIKKQLQTERQTQADRQYENEVVKAISDKARLTVPPSLIEEEVLRMEEDEKRDLTFRGKTWTEHLAEEKITEQQHRERQQPLATDRVRAGLVLSEIAEKENIQATDEEVQNRLDQLKTQYTDPQMINDLENPDNRSKVVSQILTEKTLSKLVGFANKK